MKFYMFRTFLCPSSGVFHCTHSNGICHTGLQTACEQEHVSDSSSVHHREFFTEHTAMVYVIQVCRQHVSRSMFRTVPLSIIGSFSPNTQQWYMSYRSADSM